MKKILKFLIPILILFIGIRLIACNSCVKKDDQDLAETFSIQMLAADNFNAVPDLNDPNDGYAYFGTYVLNNLDYSNWEDLREDQATEEHHYIYIYRGGIIPMGAQGINDYFDIYVNGWPVYDLNYFGINFYTNSNNVNGVRFYISDTPANSITEEPNTSKFYWLPENQFTEYWFDFLLVGIPQDYYTSIDSSATLADYRWVQRFFGSACVQIANPSPYQTGYDNGFTAGELAGRGQGFENGRVQGFEQGYQEGLLEGYNNAVAEGVSDTGLFYGALSFMQTFFKLATEFLGTKFIGNITLGMLTIGLPCAFMLINLAIGLVKKWLGGKGADEG